jgi:hypothetical protein
LSRRFLPRATFFSINSRFDRLVEYLSEHLERAIDRAVRQRPIELAL